MTLLQVQEAAKSLAGQDASTAYDTIWANPETQAPVGLESVFLAQDKLYVVLVVVLIIWFGILLFLYRTDRKIDKLERTLKNDIHDTKAHTSGAPSEA